MSREKEYVRIIDVLNSGIGGFIDILILIACARNQFAGTNFRVLIQLHGEAATETSPAGTTTAVRTDEGQPNPAAPRFVRRRSGRRHRDGGSAVRERDSTAGAERSSRSPPTGCRSDTAGSGRRRLSSRRGRTAAGRCRRPSTGWRRRPPRTASSKRERRGRPSAARRVRTRDTDPRTAPRCARRPR